MVGEGRELEPQSFHGHDIHLFQSEPKWPKRGRRFVRWLRWSRYQGLVRFLDRISEQTGRGPIVAVFPDEFHLAAAHAVASRRGLPFFPYFHNTYVDNRTGVSRQLGKALEARVMRDAESAMVLTSALEDHYRARYPEARLEVLPHSFAFESMNESATRRSEGEVRIGILGNINHSNMDAFLRLFRAIDESMVVTIYAGSTPKWFFEKLGVLGPRVRHEQPSDADLYAKLRENDLLFLPHGLQGKWNSVEYRTIFPTRTAPYLGSGRPVLAHCPQECFLHDWLEARDCAEIVSTSSEDALRNAIRLLMSNRERAQQLVRNAAVAFDEFDPNRIVQKFEQIIAGGESRS